MGYNICNEIKRVIEENLDDELYVPTSEIDINENLFLVGVDSLNVIKIVLGLEDVYGIEFDDSELTIENLQSIASIEKIVINKLKVGRN